MCVVALVMYVLFVHLFVCLSYCLRVRLMFMGVLYVLCVWLLCVFVSLMFVGVRCALGSVARVWVLVCLRVYWLFC